MMKYAKNEYGSIVMKTVYQARFIAQRLQKKLGHVAGEKSLVNPYKKPQRLINRLVEIFSNVDDWVLDLFSGTSILNCFLLVGLYEIHPYRMLNEVLFYY